MSAAGCGVGLPIEGGPCGGVAKIPISGVVAHFGSLGIPHVWPRSQKYPIPWISKFLLSQIPIAMPLLGLFCEFSKSGGVAKIPISGVVAHFGSFGISGWRSGFSLRLSGKATAAPPRPEMAQICR
jgi:hypothetical protein